MTTVAGARAPSIHPEAWIAPDATVSGNVTIGAGSRIMPGARVVAEAGGSIQIGHHCIVLENAVVRATGRHNCRIGDHCLIGPNSHVVGADIEREVFIATGAAVFHGASIGHGSEVRINGAVHLRTHLAPGTTVPIGWVAVGSPAEILPADQHDAIWALQQPLDFPGFVYGIDRDTPEMMRAITEDLSDRLGPRDQPHPDAIALLGLAPGSPGGADARRSAGAAILQEPSDLADENDPTTGR